MLPAGDGGDKEVRRYLVTFSAWACYSWTRTYSVLPAGAGLSSFLWSKMAILSFTFYVVASRGKVLKKNKYKYIRGYTFICLN